MLFRRSVLDGIVAGDVTLAFRRWDRPRVRPGSRLRTAVGVLEIGAVTQVDPATVSASDVRAAGAADLREVLGTRQDRPLFRIELRYAGGDPRARLREDVPDADELAAIRARLAEIDHRSRREPWTRDLLLLIAEHPATRAPDLAAGVGRQTLPFKRDVRVLKELGLTESLAVGYRLSPRGRALVESWRDESGEPAR